MASGHKFNNLGHLHPISKHTNEGDQFSQLKIFFSRRLRLEAEDPRSFLRPEIPDVLLPHLQQLPRGVVDRCRHLLRHGCRMVSLTDRTALIPS